MKSKYASGMQLIKENTDPEAIAYNNTAIGFIYLNCKNNLAASNVVHVQLLKKWE